MAQALDVLQTKLVLVFCLPKKMEMDTYLWNIARHFSVSKEKQMADKFEHCTKQLRRWAMVQKVNEKLNLPCKEN